MKKRNLIMRLLTLFLIIAVALQTFHMSAHATEEGYEIQEIADEETNEAEESELNEENAVSVDPETADDPEKQNEGSEETVFLEESAEVNESETTVLWEENAEMNESEEAVSREESAEAKESEENRLNIVPKRAMLKGVQTRSVSFIVQNSFGQSAGSVTYELKKQEGNRERLVKRATLNKRNKTITFENLELNTQYKLYLTSVPKEYGKPDGSVAEFYFDSEGIHFTKGGTEVVLTMTSGYVHFIVQNTSGLPVGVVNYTLKKLTNNRETVVKSGAADRGTGKIILEKLAWNTTYRLYLTSVPKEYEKPVGFVAEFHFDSAGIHFTKGNTAVVLNKKNNNGQDVPLAEGQYYGFTGQDSRIKISKEYNIATGIDAFCFDSNKDFPDFGNKAVYNELSTSAETLYGLAERPRGTPKELYDSVRKVIYYCETHKEELLTVHQLNSDAFWFGSPYKEKGYYRALQEAIWYYSNSLNSLKNYKPGSVGYSIMKKAVQHIIQESPKVSKEEMETVKLKIYSTSMLGEHNSPLQPLITFEIEKKINIKIQKVNENGESLEGAVFKLEKQEDATFLPIEMGTDPAVSEFIFKNLTAGKYLLTEKKAPENYISLKEPIRFEIKETDGVLKIILNSSDPKVFLENDKLTIKVANEKKKTTSIIVDKKWFRADGTGFYPLEGSIVYDLMQVLITEGGEISEKVYRAGEILTSQDQWTKEYSDLPKADTNENGEKVTFAYYVKEILIADYSTSYGSAGVEDTESPSAVAISSGTITIKNKEKMKFTLPETGGTGRGALYIAGALLLGISLLLFGSKKNGSFYQYLHKRG
ncbi:SpaA isopeptide-forming pilin-related protein [[Ruminococcus] torques]|uniref:SpaA isopeptide-forming pilin-related protein n=1 Tax=[Ruminococcus] torques TaxID=33039 RepID=UPI00242E108A|nr:SpaA isopeptide-forming pilin-related protein [[Ruminococcus] torques]